MDQRDMQAITTASGIAAIRPIFAIALGMVNIICPICTQVRYASAGLQAGVFMVHAQQWPSEEGAGLPEKDAHKAAASVEMQPRRFMVHVLQQPSQAGRPPCGS